MPEWLLEELLELAEAFDHLPHQARHEAMRRNMSRRADAYFDARAERRVRQMANDEYEALTDDEEAQP